MKATQNCSNCGAALEFDESDIIDKKYIKCQYCSTMNLVDLDDDSLKSVKNMALHSVKEYKIKKSKEYEYKNSTVGKLEETRTLITVLSGAASFFGIVIAINMLVALYDSNSMKNLIFFSILLVLSLALAIIAGTFCVRKFKEYTAKIENEKNK